MRTSLRIALLTLVSALALFLVACGDDEDGGGGTDTKDARALLAKAFEKPAASGDLRLRIGLDLQGVDSLNGPAVLTLKGPFEDRGASKLPRADWDVGVKAGGLAFEGKLKLTDDNAFLEFQGEAYELGNLVDELPKEAREGGLDGLRLDPASWLEDPKLEDGQEIGGDSTRRVTGSVNVEKVVNDLLSALRSPELQRELGPLGKLLPSELSDEDRKKLRDAVKKFDFEANVDEDDVLRRILVKAGFDVPSDAGIGGLRGGEVTFDYVLEKVGGEVDVEAPKNPQPLRELLRNFGVPDPFGPTQRQ